MENSKIKNTISYKGQVKVVFKDNKGKTKKTEYHNEGKLALFTSVCRALAGYDINAYKPQYIMCYSGNGDDIPYTRILVAKVVSSATPSLYYTENDISEESTQSCNTIEYVFTIPITAIARISSNGGEDQNIEISKLSLLNSRNEECATILLNGSSNDPNAPIEISNAVDTSNILIYWKLQFENQITT